VGLPAASLAFLGLVFFTSGILETRRNNRIAMDDTSPNSVAA
jgi:hypothetical protein